MLLRELFENILLVEYNREKTAATFGNKLLKALMADRSMLPLSTMGPLRTYLIQKEKIGVPIEPHIRRSIIDDLLGVIESGDPTQHKEYTQWLVKCYANDDVILEDIISKGADWLETYNQMKIRRILPVEYRDIMKFKFNDLYGIVSNQDLVKKLNQPSTESDKGSSKVVLDTGTVRIIRPYNREAACYYGQGTRWCTASTKNNMYDYYATDGALYILLPKQPTYDGEKYQLHFATNQFMDEQDKPIDLEWVITTRFGDLSEFFKSIEPVLKEYLIFADPAVYEKLVDDIKDIAMDQVHEILSDWEAEDGGYYTWLMKKGYQDEDGNIDWDKVEKDDIGWFNYNEVARSWYNRAINSLSPTKSDLLAVYEEVLAWDFGGDAELPTLDNLPYLIADNIRHELITQDHDSGDHGLSDWVMDHIVVNRRIGNQFTAQRYR